MHHTILLPPPILPINKEPINLLLKVTPVLVWPNGNLIDKDARLPKACLQIIDTNKILFISPGNHIRHNNVLIRMHGKSNLCLLSPCTMKELLKWLSVDDFLQIHDAYIINQYFACSISPHIEVNLIDFELALPIGRGRSELVDRVLLPQKPFLPKRSHHKKHVNQ